MKLRAYDLPQKVISEKKKSYISRRTIDACVMKCTEDDGMVDEVSHGITAAWIQERDRFAPRLRFWCIGLDVVRYQGAIERPYEPG